MNRSQYISFTNTCTDYAQCSSKRTQYVVSKNREHCPIKHVLCYLISRGCCVAKFSSKVGEGGVKGATRISAAGLLQYQTPATQQNGTQTNYCNSRLHETRRAIIIL